MKENKYDENSFFEKYSQMSRSQHGLEAAGEWATLKPMLPSFAGKRVLDLGCGYGWHCIYAAQQGAARVVGTDISQKMLEVAREKTSASQVEYHCVAMEDLDYPAGSFDVVLSSLAFHYIEDFEACAKKIYEMLAPHGVFVFSAEHPVFTAEGRQDWVYDETGAIKHFPVDNYFYEGKRQAGFLGEEVVKYHRTFTSYINTLLKAGFAIRAVEEPQPPEEMRKTVAGMEDEMRRPMMLIVRAEKEERV